MPLLRIVKRYNRLSPKNGIVEVDKVHFKDRGQATAWLNSATVARGVDFDILHAEWVLVNLGAGAEVIENPTGGHIGKVP